jgi:predicted GH43/DUF377 family glycosyl hydrolase
LSPIFAEAARKWQEMSLEFMAYVDDAYNKALEATAGVLVNAEGRAKHIDGYILFRSNRAFSQKYASEELKEHWENHPRLTMIEYEKQWMEGRLEWSTNPDAL